MGGFERIRQDARRDVYCNGARHVELLGTGVGRMPLDKTNPPAEVQVLPCSCGKLIPIHEKVPA